MQLNDEQKVWCMQYKEATDFEPLIDDFLAGNESFAVASRKSVLWFEDYCADAQRNIPNLLDDD